RERDSRAGSELVCRWPLPGVREGALAGARRGAAGKATPVPGSAGLVSPRWSPDGRYLAAMPADSGGLMLYEFRTERWTVLARLHIGYPNWSRDGAYIYFDRFAEPRGIGRLRLAGRRLENVFTPREGDPIWTIDSWTGLDADDSVLLLNDASVQQIYALRWIVP